MSSYDSDEAALVSELADIAGDRMVRRLLDMEVKWETFYLVSLTTISHQPCIQLACDPPTGFEPIPRIYNSSCSSWP